MVVVVVLVVRGARLCCRAERVVVYPGRRRVARDSTARWAETVKMTTKWVAV